MLEGADALAALPAVSASRHAIAGAASPVWPLLMGASALPLLGVRTAYLGEVPRFARLSLAPTFPPIPPHTHRQTGREIESARPVETAERCKIGDCCVHGLPVLLLLFSLAMRQQGHGG